MISLASCNIFRTSPPPAQPKEYDSLYYSYSIKDSEETEDYFICSLELTIKEELAVQEI